MNNTIKRHTVSALVTFFSTFFVVLGIQIQGNFVDVENISYGIGISLVMTACRAGVKAVVESLK